MPLAITGSALLTPLGAGEETWEAMRAGRRVGRDCAVGEAFLEGEAGLDRSIRIGLGVARRALGGGSCEGMGLFCGTSKGPIGVMLGVYAGVCRGEMPGELAARQVALGVGAMGVILRERLGMTGVTHTSVAACSSGMHALHRAARAIRMGECERALVVAADASLYELFEGSFARLGVLAPAGADGTRRCEPFGEKGRGFFVSEAGAAVVVEGEMDAATRGHGDSARGDPIAWLEESWIGGDSTGLIAVDGRTEALRAGLRACGGGERLAFVHAHATGTEHDAYELEAVRAVAGEDVPVFSHKGFLGHSLGAAGLVSVVLSVECHRRGVMINGMPVNGGSRSLTIAQGFGGHIGVVRLRGGR